MPLHCAQGLLLFKTLKVIAKILGTFKQKQQKKPVDLYSTLKQYVGMSYIHFVIFLNQLCNYSNYAGLDMQS